MIIYRQLNPYITVDGQLEIIPPVFAVIANLDQCDKKFRLAGMPSFSLLSNCKLSSRLDHVPSTQT